MKAYRLLAFVLSFTTFSSFAQSPVIEISKGWQVQDIAKVADKGEKISTLAYQPKNWYKATVPGTVLTSLVNNKVYPEPLYGENNRPDKISEYLCRTSYWYKTTMDIPQSYTGKNIFLNFDGINYEANVFVNGKQAGNIKGAFARGIFDITSLVTPGKKAALAVLIKPQPTPGISHEHNIATGMGYNGWYTGYDGPTFLCSIGWDWIPAIRDRNTGIWQKVFLSANDAVTIKDPLVTTDLPLPDTTQADISISTGIQNHSAKIQKGILKAKFGDAVVVEQPFEIAANSISSISFSSFNIKHPKLWWPNGYGEQNLYKLSLSVELNGKVSDSKQMMIGVREYSYSVPNSEWLTVSVNGVPVICKGGNWGMDEAMKRLSYQRMDAQMRMHKLANYTMIRNWVGQSTSEMLYELCDKYGFMLWDEFFQANPSDGPNPKDIHLYLYNVREKIVRYRNHASIAIWCARNEGFPPKEIEDSLVVMMHELEPSRLYQSSSTEGRGVNSGGPYSWRTPVDFYNYNEAFKTETGTMSIPTIESIQGMMPKEDWEEINDDWAEHDFAIGAQKGDKFPGMIDKRYGAVKNLADFVRKSQLANYESYRAMYEGRFAKLFSPVTGVLTWMSHPAQPSFVWQLYHYDLEPNASLFATRKACEPLHVQLNEKEGFVQVINATPNTLENAHVSLGVFGLDGKKIYEALSTVNADASKATTVKNLSVPKDLQTVHFIRLQLLDASQKLISDNFYWKGATGDENNFTALDSMPIATLKASAIKKAEGNKLVLQVVLENTSDVPAIMTHLQLRNSVTNKRVLPVFYNDNYISLLPGESKTIFIEAALSDLNGQQPIIMIDGLNSSVAESNSNGVAISMNKNAMVSSWPVTGLPFSPFNMGKR